MYIIFVDTPEIHSNLLPMTYTRPAARLRTGILTIWRRWQALCNAEVGYDTVEYLRCKFSVDPDKLSGHVVRIFSNVEPDRELALAVEALTPGQALVDTDGATVAWRPINPRCDDAAADYEKITFPAPVRRVNQVYDIFQGAFERVEFDFDLLTAGKVSRPVPESVKVIGDPSRVFIDADAADVEGAIFNTRHGCVYIGPGAVVMEGACLRGPVAIGEHAQVNMGARIYGGTSIGPWCKVGGELNNVVMQSYSNKAHDGFLGNAVVGKWCNIGAGCTASNLKNDYTPIKLWNYPARRFVKTDLQFCGVIMGDHAKCGINTMLNTATVLGVGVNIHGSGFPRPFVASFSEGSAAGFTDVPMSKFFDIARRMMQRRGLPLTDSDIAIFESIREQAEAYR